MVLDIDKILCDNSLYSNELFALYDIHNKSTLT